MRLNDALRYNVAVRGDAPAVREGDEVLDFRALRARSGRLAATLAGWAPPGSRVCVYLPNGLIYPEIFFATAMAGMIAVPVGPHLVETDLVRIFGECGPAVLITHAPQAARVAAAAEAAGLSVPVLCWRQPGGALPPGWTDYAEAIAPGVAPLATDRSQADDPAILLFTSGTTGRPKGVIHSQANFMRGAVALAASIGLSGPGRALQVLPVAGINFLWMLAFHAAGLELVMLPRFDAAAFPRLMAQERITHTVIAPIMLDMISRDPAAAAGCDFSALRMLGYGGSRSAGEVIARAVAIYGPVIRQMYGQTEAAGLLTSKPFELHAGDVESAGVPLLGVDLRIFDPEGQDISASGATGEIRVRAGFTFIGYWGRSDIGAPADGWLRTGDTGRLTADGRLVIMGRTDDMIVTGGNNVYPREVEDVLTRHPRVAEAAVVGVPDPVWGERVTAFVIARGAAGAGLEAELRAMAEAALASAKRPRAWHFVAALPRNPTGKVVRAELVRMAAEPHRHRADDGKIAG